jgi:hypothetical protein
MTLDRTIYGGQSVDDLPPVQHLLKMLNAEQLLLRSQFSSIKPRPYVLGHQQRMGKHNTERLSQYRVLKEYHWPAAYKSLLADHLLELVPREATHGGCTSKSAACNY